MVLLSSSKVWQDPKYFFAFGFGSGLLPWAPGTWGTLTAIPLYFIIQPFSPFFYLFAVLVLFILGVYASEKITKDLGIEDYSGIVCDEIVGYLLTMFLAPRGFLWVGLGFLLFRLFDIWKPFPINWVESRLKGGVGIMVDDVMAALPAWILLQFFAWLLPL